MDGAQEEEAEGDFWDMLEAERGARKDVAMQSRRKNHVSLRQKRIILEN